MFKEVVITTQGNLFFMIQRKDGLVVIKLSTIGINFKNCQHAQLVFIVTKKMKDNNFPNQ